VEHKGEHTLPSKNGINGRPLSSLARMRETPPRMTSEYGRFETLTAGLAPPDGANARDALAWLAAGSQRPKDGPLVKPLSSIRQGSVRLCSVRARLLFGYLFRPRRAPAPFSAALRR